jgi:hypothetical protein
VWLDSGAGTPEEQVRLLSIGCRPDGIYGTYHAQKKRDEEDLRSSILARNREIQAAGCASKTTNETIEKLEKAIKEYPSVRVLQKPSLPQQR